MPGLLQSVLWGLRKYIVQKRDADEREAAKEKEGGGAATEDAEAAEEHEAVTLEPSFTPEVRFSLGILGFICIGGVVFTVMGLLPRWRDRLAKGKKKRNREKIHVRMAHHAVFGAYQEKTEAQKRMTLL